jgi:hypothetical protein
LSWNLSQPNAQSDIDEVKIKNFLVRVWGFRGLNKPIHLISIGSFSHCVNGFEILNKVTRLPVQVLVPSANLSALPYLLSQNYQVFIFTSMPFLNGHG